MRLADVISRYSAEEWSAYAAAFPDAQKRMSALRTTLAMIEARLQETMYARFKADRECYCPDPWARSEGLCIVSGRYAGGCNCFIEARERENEREALPYLHGLRAEVDRAMVAVSCGMIESPWGRSEGPGVLRNLRVDGEHFRVDILKNGFIRIHGLHDALKYERTDAGYIGVECVEAVDKVFRIGDEAEHSSYNLIYTGTIVSISEKTVRIADRHAGKTPSGKTRTQNLKLATFVSRNWDFDAARVAAHNADTMMVI